MRYPKEQFTIYHNENNHRTPESLDRTGPSLGLRVNQWRCAVFVPLIVCGVWGIRVEEEEEEVKEDKEEEASLHLLSV